MSCIFSVDLGTIPWLGNWTSGEYSKVDKAKADFVLLLRAAILDPETKETEAAVSEPWH
jgi:hypothetical protein